MERAHRYENDYKATSYLYNSPEALSCTLAVLSWYPFDLPSLAVNYTLTEVISNEQRLFFDLPDMPNQFSGEITFSDTGVATEEMLNVLVFVSLTSVSPLWATYLKILVGPYMSTLCCYFITLPFV